MWCYNLTSVVLHRQQSSVTPSTVGCYTVNGVVESGQQCAVTSAAVCRGGTFSPKTIPAIKSVFWYNGVARNREDVSRGSRSSLRNSSPVPGRFLRHRRNLTGSAKAILRWQCSILSAVRLTQPVHFAMFPQHIVLILPYGNTSHGEDKEDSQGPYSEAG